ncbi:hypothetical protein LSAT2_000859 [Lamellibrachia satsuma]|nr:hypothetical protein LSAT2_000859 [Lamellibrachia satsuma]
MAEKHGSTSELPDQLQTVRPEDSVSQTGSRASRRSEASHSSSLFSEASAAMMKEEAKKGELIARAIALNKSPTAKNITCVKDASS